MMKGFCCCWFLCVPKFNWVGIKGGGETWLYAGCRVVQGTGMIPVTMIVCNKVKYIQYIQIVSEEWDRVD